MADATPTGGPGVFQRQGTARDELAPAGGPTSDGLLGEDELGSTRQAVVLLGLIQRIQTLEGVASRDRLDKILAEQGLSAGEADVAAQEQIIILAESRMADFRRISTDVVNDVNAILQTDTFKGVLGPSDFESRKKLIRIRGNADGMSRAPPIR